MREDPTRRGLLYAGTQHGFYISYNDGERWESLSLNLPDTQVSDIAVEANDIAIATHGRGFYVLDNVGALRQAGSAVTTASDFYLFAPGDAIRGAGGATITYLLRKPADKLALDILDRGGAVIRHYDGAAPNAGRGGRGGRGRGDTPPAATPPAAEEPPTPEADPAAGGRGRGAPGAPIAAGLQRFTWDLQYAPASSFPGMILWGGSVNGPAALPGAYQVRLTVDGRAQTQPLTVKKHLLHTGQAGADLKEQCDLAIQVRDKVSEANNSIIQIRKSKDQVNDRLKKSQDGDFKAVANRLVKNLSDVEEQVYQVRNQSGQDPLNFPIKTNNRLAALLRVVDAGDGKPIGNAAPIFKDLTAELKAETDKLQQVLTSDLPAVNRLATRLGLEPINDK